MKLHRLYCNDSRFHDITFNDGLNVVLGHVTHYYDMDKDSHNLGKSTLIDVIDFMLLKEIDKNFFLKRYPEQFVNHIFYLELLLNSKMYLTIRRSVAAATKISFKEHEASEDCGLATNWDKKDLSLKVAKKYLNDKLGFDVLTNWDYRKTVSFFLRTQMDYYNEFQLGKFMKSKHEQWKPIVFELLGYDSSALLKKYDLDDKQKELKTEIKAIREGKTISADDYDKVKSALDLRKSERDEMQKKIDTFSFYSEERIIGKDLVVETERKISELNTKEYALSYDLEKMKSSIKNIPTFDIEQLKKLYEEVKVIMPHSLAHNYQELLDFNVKVTKERNKYLREQIVNNEAQLDLIRNELKKLDNQRNMQLSVLQDKDTFRKFKIFEKKLASLEGDISRLEVQLQSIDTMSSMDEKIEEVSQQIILTSKDIKSEVSKSGDIPSVVKTNFNDIFYSIFGMSALLYVKPNSSGNVDFKVEVAPDENSDATAEGLGNSYRKMLCVAFDLAVLSVYSNKSFFRFVYHDGVFEGLDNRKKKLFIETARRYCQQYHLQYIFSSIEDDIPADILHSFKEEEKCLVLNDEDDGGKLFGFSY
ncbi:DUF2326 domain-containing protein [Xylanibacter oryzae]|uniref:DUF2326 domain-containing protein n=1 Tax=Xylanibacter oryzae TaxID=185293 RepID=UPI0004B26C39|nr:DUF2326 domain-containing protein [Xylanibacter oryzae]